MSASNKKNAKTSINRHQLLKPQKRNYIVNPQRSVAMKHKKAALYGIDQPKILC